MHGYITSPYPKFISSVMKQSEYFDEEIWKRLTLNTIPRQNSIMHLKNYAQKIKPLHALKYIYSLSCHHLQLFNNLRYEN